MHFVIEPELFSRFSTVLARVNRDYGETSRSKLVKLAMQRLIEHYEEFGQLPAPVGSMYPQTGDDVLKVAQEQPEKPAGEKKPEDAGPPRPTPILPRTRPTAGGEAAGA